MSCSGPQVYTGKEEIKDGVLVNDSITLMHNRSVAEKVIYTKDAQLFNGFVDIKNGKLDTDGVDVLGNSLLLGADLTGKAFTRSVFGEFGQYIVA